MRRIGSRVVEQSGDCRVTQFLIQIISIDVQRGNTAAVMVTMGRYHRCRIWGESACPQNVDELAYDDFVIAALTGNWKVRIRSDSDTRIHCCIYITVNIVSTCK